MPIPKFAKAMAKRAKAKPKVIVSKTTPTKQFSRKFAKDDMELAKIRKDKIRKELEPFLKKSKDDLELLKVENKLNSLCKKDFNKDDVLNYTKNLKNLLNPKNPIAKKLSAILGTSEKFSNIKPDREVCKIGLELLQNISSELCNLFKK